MNTERQTLRSELDTATRDLSLAIGAIQPGASLPSAWISTHLESALAALMRAKAAESSLP